VVKTSLKKCICVLLILIAIISTGFSTKCTLPKLKSCSDDRTVAKNCNKMFDCERFEPRSHFKSRMSLIVRVNVVLNRTVVVDSD